jgi:HSP20 family molecular chaperone IbpA
VKKRLSKEEENKMSLTRWDDLAPSTLWHPRHRRHHLTRNLGPWTETMLDDTMKDFGRTFENAFNLLERTPPLGSPQKKQEKKKMYKKKIPLVVRGVLTPDDIKVVLKDKVMDIEVKKDQKSQDGSSEFYQEYHKSINLPDDVETKDVRTILCHDGTLKVEAPYKETEPTPTEIPIELSF